MVGRLNSRATSSSPAIITRPDHLLNLLLFTPVFFFHTTFLVIPPSNLMLPNLIRICRSQ